MIAAPLIVVCAAFGLSLLTIATLAHRATRLPQDSPNHRSLHVRPVPRAGGYAIWAGFIPAAVWYPPDFPGGIAAWLPSWLALATISALDDALDVSVVARLVAHAGAALWCSAWLVIDAHDAVDASAARTIAIVAIAVLIAWGSNLYNFMDGNDGLCATMTVIGFGAFGIAALKSGDRAVPYFALVAATFPFLVVNRPRATMFLGDVGSVPLGFLAASFGIAGVVQGLWPAWFPVLAFLPFIADATVTLVRRIVRRERIFAAHRDHYYQRLHQLGAGHAGTLSIYAALMFGCAMNAVVCLLVLPQWGFVALSVWLAVCLALFAAIDYHWRKKPADSP